MKLQHQDNTESQVSLSQLIYFSIKSIRFPLQKILDTAKGSGLSSRNFTLGGKLTDHVAIGHSEGEGAGEGRTPSHAKPEAKNAYYSEVSQIGP